MIQLRVRTEFSFSETFAPIPRLIERLKALGATAAGIVDNGTWGHVQWDKACRQAGITPLFGVALGVVPNLDTEERPAMWFLATSGEGLRELYRFSSLAQRQAIRGQPRLTYADVARMGKGIAKFAGGVLDGAFLKSIGAFLDLDPGTPVANARKTNIARAQGLKTVAVSDNYFANSADRSVFEMVGRQSKTTPQHLLNEAEMKLALGVTSLKAEIAVAEKLAKQAKGITLARAPLIQVEGDLEALCRAGIQERHMAWPEEYEQRLQYELQMIRSKEFESYFLMVADMVRYAKQHMLVGPSRGSAAGSLVCYLSRITEIDPIPARLIFERFIDVNRSDLPDIDLDFPDTKRHMVLDYLKQKYGERNVAQIGTVSRYKPKSALTTVAKRLNIPPWEVDAVKDSIFARSSGDSRANFALLDTLQETEPGKHLLAKHPAMRLAAEIEAHAQHSGVHAAGILVCNKPVEDFCTVTADGIAQLDKKDAEELNLLKVDVLGLRTLGIIEDAGVPVNWYGLTFDDQEAFDIINDKKYAGIFQFEGEALKSVSSQMRVESIDDIGHITALARPGPMASGGTTAFLLRRAGKEPYRVPHPLMEKYVSETYGVVVYQEQVLRVCREIGGLSWSDVMKIQKAMSKSFGKEYFDQFRDKFVVGSSANGVNQECALAIWDMVNTMGSWAFNLAHSYSYAVVSYWTAYLKAKHRLEFAAATLRSAKNEDSALLMLRELVQEGFDYVPFDPWLSEVNWSVKDGKLVGGFMGLKGIGESKAQKIVEERAAMGGRLSEKTLAMLAECEQVYADPFPTESRWGSYYSDPQQHGIRSGTKVVRISEISGEAEFVYLGRLRGKDLRDYNESIRVKRRNGKLYKGQTLFLDLDIEDDTGKILTRIDRHDFEEMGREIWDSAPLNSWWLVRGERRLWGRPDGGFKMIFVKKIKRLDRAQGSDAS